MELKEKIELVLKWAADKPRFIPGVSKTGFPDPDEENPLFDHEWMKDLVRSFNRNGNLLKLYEDGLDELIHHFKIGMH